MMHEFVRARSCNAEDASTPKNETSDVYTDPMSIISSHYQYNLSSAYEFLVVFG